MFYSINAQLCHQLNQHRKQNPQIEALGFQHDSPLINRPLNSARVPRCTSSSSPNREERKKGGKIKENLGRDNLSGRTGRDTGCLTVALRCRRFPIVFLKRRSPGDINYPASVNHVIYRPRPRAPTGLGQEGGGGTAVEARCIDGGALHEGCTAAN